MRPALPLQRQLDILYDDRLAERITPERWELKQTAINAEQADIRAKMEQIKSEETKYFELYINMLDLARRAREIYANRTPAERRQLLQHIFSKLLLKDQKLDYELKAPLAKLSKRVHERIDAQKIFEPQKTLSRQGKRASAAQNELNAPRPPSFPNCGIFTRWYSPVWVG